MLIIAAPAIFALKVALDIRLPLSGNETWNDYWNQGIYWPLLLLILLIILYVFRKMYYSKETFFGATIKNYTWTPYLLFLLLMMPIIAAASTQPDFLAMYPKLQLISGVYNETEITWWHKLLLKLSYGSNFIGIELFFRDFLIQYSGNFLNDET